MIKHLIRFGVISLLLLPVVSGLGVTFSLAFGYFPILGSYSLSLDNFIHLFSLPSFWTITLRTVIIGVSSTLISLFLTYAFLVFCSNRPRLYLVISQSLSPLLSIPHMTVALGVIYLFSVSGTLGRLLYWISGEQIDFTFAPDSQGYGMILALVIKEVPYLILMSLGAHHQIKSSQFITISRTLGYSYSKSWLYVVLPIIHRQIRLPILATLVFSLSSPEHNILLLPRNATGLTGFSIDLYNYSDLSYQMIAAASATFIIVLCLLVILLWSVSEKLLSKLFKVAYFHRGKRYYPFDNTLSVIFGVMTIILPLIGILSLVVMFLWSFSKIWRYPDILPTRISLENWLNVSLYYSATVSSLLIACASVIISLILTIIFLETENSKNIPKLTENNMFSSFSRVLTFLVYIPLITPQISFVFGLKLILSSISSSIPFLLISLIYGHIIFVFPYILISLISPYKHFDSRYISTAQCLGHSYLSANFKVKWPLLKAPILFSCAIGFTVSLSLYLPTLILGGGRYTTISVETIALASGGNPRVTALLTIIQTLLSLLVMYSAILFAKKRYTHQVSPSDK